MSTGGLLELVIRFAVDRYLNNYNGTDILENSNMTRICKEKANDF